MSRDVPHMGLHRDARLDIDWFCLPRQILGRGCLKSGHAHLSGEWPVDPPATCSSLYRALTRIRVFYSKTNLSYEPKVGSLGDLELLLTGDTEESSSIRLKFTSVSDPDRGCYGKLVGRWRGRRCCQLKMISGLLGGGAHHPL